MLFAKKRFPSFWKNLYFRLPSKTLRPDLQNNAKKALVSASTEMPLSSASSRELEADNRQKLSRSHAADCLLVSNRSWGEVRLQQKAENLKRKASPIQSFFRARLRSTWLSWKERMKSKTIRSRSPSPSKPVISWAIRGRGAKFYHNSAISSCRNQAEDWNEQFMENKHANLVVNANIIVASVRWQLRRTYNQLQSVILYGWSLWLAMRRGQMKEPS